ncbi:MAG: carbon-nitrogen hydrolase family protein [Candidatus Bathyarchaeota archaeon]|nr:MAG: carbon-nitrogen hydrolase family protein [Candidatus Bathyarchaeota archaeon]
MVRIGLVQMLCEKGAIAENLESTAHYLDDAFAHGIDIVCFPEMSITGYADPTKHPEAITRLDGPEINQLLEMTRGNPTTVLAGLIEENPYRKPFITQVVVRDGELLGFYRKMRIVDEEADWFSPGDFIPVFMRGELSFGIALCADIGSHEVFAECARQGAKIVFEAAAPGLHGEQATRDWRAGFEWWEAECKKYLSRYAKKYSMWVAVATQAGRTVDEDFPGGGYVFAPDGQRLYATPNWSPRAVYLDMNFSECSVIQL